MAAARADLPQRLLPALLVTLAFTLQGGAAGAAEPVADITIEAAGFHLNYADNTLRLPNVVIQQDSPQGRMLIRADEAIARGTEPSFDNSAWEFRGAVHIEFAGGELDADSADVRFRGNRPSTARVVGAPARFSHQMKDSAQRNQGRARTIDFDMQKGTVRLAGDAWYSDGRNEITTEAILYSLADRSAQNERGPAEGNRVRMTIRPGSGAVPPATDAPVTP